MFIKELDLDFPALEQIIGFDLEKSAQLCDKFCERVFYAGHAGISSQELQSWESQGFFPYEYKEKGWRKFSFIEYIWLKCIQKLRSMDVSHKKILFLKDVFFSLEKEELLKMIPMAPWFKNMGMEKYLMLAELELDEEHYKKAKDMMCEKQLSRFSMLIFPILILKANISLIIDENANCSFIMLGDGTVDILGNEISVNDMLNKSCLILNLRNIVFDFFEDENLAFPTDYVMGFLNNRQKKVLDAMKEEGITSVTVHFSNSEPVRIEVTKSKITKETLNRVARFLKKKNFQNIQFKVRDGDLIQFEETDLIKLDKSGY